MTALSRFTVSAAACLTLVACSNTTTGGGTYNFPDGTVMPDTKTDLVDTTTSDTVSDTETPLDTVQDGTESDTSLPDTCQGADCPFSCTPDAVYCDGKSVMKCNADGKSGTVEKVCPSGEFCKDGGCAELACAPNEATCFGTVATKCKADGSGWIDPGENCAMKQLACSNGACKAQTCTPNTVYCDGKKSLECSADGTSATLKQICGSSEFCGNGVCKPQICDAGQFVCKGTISTTCNQDGSAYVGDQIDCAFENKVCWLGQCITQECGNGIAEGSEECDDGNKIDTDGCISTCKLATCGDSLVWKDVEECDDGNLDPDDGCLNGCIKDCSDRAKKVYVVTEQKVLLRFDVEALQLVKIGVLNCPTSGTPFSMSVDRDANAWVLYQDSKIYKVSTLDASCQATSFKIPNGNYEVFGMGFSSDVPGGKEETLFIAGNASFIYTASQANLASVSFPAMTVSPISKIALTGGPELTGTGNAELWGFFPNVSKVGRIDKTNGSIQQQLNIPMSMSSVQAWAFAAYGGKFYLFFKSVTDPMSTVYELDPATGAFQKVIGNTGYTIVGAGVSSCAPTKL